MLRLLKVDLKETMEERDLRGRGGRGKGKARPTTFQGKFEQMQ